MIRSLTSLLQIYRPSFRPKDSGYHRIVVMSAVGFIVCCGHFSGHLSAQIVNWANVSGGVFSTGSNWTGGAAPNSTQDANFDIAGANLGVTFNAPAITRGLRIGDGIYSFNLGGNTYSLINNSQFVTPFAMGLANGETGSLSLVDGTFTTNIAAFAIESGTNSTLSLGAGSRFLVGQQINVGLNGTGSLFVNNGAEFVAGNLIVAHEQSSAGTLGINGPSATVFASSASFGIDGDAQIRISNGGTLNSFGTNTIAQTTTSTSSLQLEDSASIWNLSNASLFSGSGNAQFQILGTLNAINSNISLSQTSDMIVAGGKLNFSGQSTSGFRTGGSFQVANGGIVEIASDAGLTVLGTGQMVVNGGKVNTTNLELLGSLEFRSGEIAVDGGVFSRTGSLSISGITGRSSLSLTDGAATSGLTSLVVGNSGTNQSSEVHVLSGSTLNTSALSTIGQFGQNAVLQISGNGSTWNANNAVSIGDAGGGSLVIENGGYLNTNGNSILTGVAGAGGNGQLTVMNGGLVDAGNIELARIAGSTSSAAVSGTGTSVHASNLIVGGSISGEGGTASLQVDSGAEVNVAGTLRARNLGTINISGGQVTTQNFIRSATGTLNFRDGEMRVLGSYINGSSDVSLVGTSVSDSPHLVLAGAASTSGITNMNVGSSNRQGSLSVLANAQLVTGALNVGNMGTVNLDGGRLLLNSFASSGSFNWTSGTVDFTSSSSLDSTTLTQLLGSGHNLGDNRSLGSNGGTLTLNSILNVNGGTLGPANLTNNSTLAVNQGQIATNLLTNNAGRLLLVSGNSSVLANSGFNNSGAFRMNSPTALISGGRLTNNAGGTISGTGQINNNVDNFGTIRVTGPEHLVFNGSENMNVLNINLAGGTLEFTQSLFNRDGAAITGRGTLISSSASPGSTGLLNDGLMSFSAGITDIHGDIDQTSGGRIVTSGNAVTTFFDDVIHNGLEIRTFHGSTTVFLGEQTGAGNFTGTGVVEYAGDLRPGNSPASISYEGDVFFNNSVRSFFELGGLNVGQFDQLLIDGDFNVDGSLFVNLINGHTLGANEFYQIAEVGGILSGQFHGLDEGDLVGTFGGRDLFISYSQGNGNGIALYTAVPEPSGSMLLSIAVLRLGFYRRGRQGC